MAAEIVILVGPDPIDPPAGLPVRDGTAGAVVRFAGVVRARTGDRETAFLEYEAYDVMAERELRRIAEDAAGRFGLASIRLHHRTGRIEPGETALLVEVSAPHRADAFAACGFAVDEIKRDVPIFKREHGPDGTFWVEPPPTP